MAMSNRSQQHQVQREMELQLFIGSAQPDTDRVVARHAVPKEIYEFIGEDQDAAAAWAEGDKTELVEESRCCWIE
jgi:hypothetical protein